MTYPRTPRPNGYPTAPACFQHFDLASLEDQYQFYLRAYGPFDQAVLRSGTRHIIAHIQGEIQHLLTHGVQATLFG